MGKDDTLGKTLTEAMVPSAVRDTVKPDEEDPIEKAARGLNRLADTTKRTLRVVYFVAVIVVASNVAGYFATDAVVSHGLEALDERRALDDARQALRDQRADQTLRASEKLATSVSLAMRSQTAATPEEATKAKGEAEVAALEAEAESAVAERTAIETKVAERKLAKSAPAPEAPQRIRIVNEKVERLRKRAKSRKAELGF